MLLQSRIYCTEFRPLNDSKPPVSAIVQVTIDKCMKSAQLARRKRADLLFNCACRPARSLMTFAVCVSPSPTLPRARGVTPEAWRSLCALRAHVVHTQVSSVGHWIVAPV